MSAPSPLIDEGLPLVCSCIKGDAGFDHGAIRLSDRIDVLLDGVVLPEACAWNVPEGIVTVPLYCGRDDGRRMLDGQGLPAFISRRGKVEVRWIRESAAA